MAIIEHQNDLAYGLAELIKLDPRFEPVAALSGPLPMRKLSTGFAGLANVIVSQMISRASADAIWSRMMLSPNVLTSAGYLAVNLEQAKRFGLSAAKHQTIYNLAHALEDGVIDLAVLATMDGGRAHKTLTALKGIGPWTAEVYLLFALGHSDVFPVGDVALQAAAQNAFGFEIRPNAREMSQITLQWQPWRSIAARSLWAYYSVVMKRTVTPLP